MEFAFVGRGLAVISEVCLSLRVQGGLHVGVRDGVTAGMVDGGCWQAKLPPVSKSCPQGGFTALKGEVAERRTVGNKVLGGAPSSTPPSR